MKEERGSKRKREEDVIVENGRERGRRKKMNAGKGREGEQEER